MKYEEIEDLNYKRFHKDLIIVKATFADKIKKYYVAQSYNLKCDGDKHEDYHVMCIENSLEECLKKCIILLYENQRTLIDKVHNFIIGFGGGEVLIDVPDMEHIGNKYLGFDNFVIYEKNKKIGILNCYNDPDIIEDERYES